VTIREFFHLIHIVDNEDEVDAFYDKLFAPMRFQEKHWFDTEKRWASLSMVSDLMLEVIEPSQAEADLHMPLSRFHSRFGQHFHSLAWYVDDLQETCRMLRQHDIRLFDMVGNAVTDPGRGDAVWTHPQDTHAAFEFAVAPRFFIDPRLQPGWSIEFPRDQHPLGIERVSHITMLFRDLTDAQRVYQQALGAKLIHEQELPGYKRSLFYAVGEDTVIEAAQPLAVTGAEGRELEQAGEGIFGVTFKTRNLAHAADHLRANDVRFEREDHSLTINRDDAFGMRLGFTDQTLANDPRR